MISNVSYANANSRAVLLLGGSTCAGKTSLALALAERYDAEIVGADSRQIYRDMPIGTAAPTPEERARVPHHLVGFLAPVERYSAARFVADASTAIAAIHARGKRAIVVGGTGFYLRALAGDVALARTYDAGLRERIVREAALHPPEVLHAWLAVRAPERARAIAASDRYRVARALEIALAAPGAVRDESPPEAAACTSRSLRDAGIAFAKFALDVSAPELDARIERRVDAMLAAGLVDEAERIGGAAVAADAVGYPEALAYLDGRVSARELRALLVRATRRYAKRQRTWFRGEAGLRFVTADEAPAAIAAALGWDAERRMPSAAT